MSDWSISGTRTQAKAKRVPYYTVATVRLGTNYSTVVDMNCYRKSFVEQVCTLFAFCEARQQQTNCVRTYVRSPPPTSFRQVSTSCMTCVNITMSSLAFRLLIFVLDVLCLHVQYLFWRFYFLIIT